MAQGLNMGDGLGGGLGLDVVAVGGAQWIQIWAWASPFELSDETIEAQTEGIVCQFEALWEENIRLLKSIGEMLQEELKL
ncbi:hypothetical protein FH972_009906 [Carpinus fangiana]|uniref:Uncharacterized protein n=1 Tax=Carpinus fangiana TaxID=176857 RepID=A0A660KTN3_9ROSI|nr:hypothetical protein FH972_009906 [Carpinus fangiana]